MASKIPKQIEQNNSDCQPPEIPRGSLTRQNQVICAKNPPYKPKQNKMDRIKFKEIVIFMVKYWRTLSMEYEKETKQKPLGPESEVLTEEVVNLIAENLNIIEPIYDKISKTQCYETISYTRNFGVLRKIYVDKFVKPILKKLSNNAKSDAGQSDEGARGDLSEQNQMICTKIPDRGSSEDLSEQSDTSDDLKVQGENELGLQNQNQRSPSKLQAELSTSRNQTGCQSPKPQKPQDDVSRQNQKICTRIPACNPCNADCGAVNETINPNGENNLIDFSEPGDENVSGLQNQNQRSPSKLQAELSISRNKTGRQSPKPQKTEEDVSRQNLKICTRIPACNPCSADCGAVNETINPNDENLPVLINPLEPGDENESALPNQNTTSRKQTGRQLQKLQYTAPTDSSRQNQTVCTKNPNAGEDLSSQKTDLINVLKTGDKRKPRKQTGRQPPQPQKTVEIDLSRKHKACTKDPPCKRFCNDNCPVRKTVDPNKQTGRQPPQPQKTVEIDLSRQHKTCTKDPPCTRFCNDNCAGPVNKTVDPNGEDTSSQKNITEVLPTEEIRSFAVKYGDEFIKVYKQVITGVELGPGSSERNKEVRAFISENMVIVKPIHDNLESQMQRKTKRERPRPLKYTADIVEAMSILREMYLNRFGAPVNQKILEIESVEPQRDKGTEEDVSRQNQKICTRIPACNPCNADCGAVNETINPNVEDLPVLINPLEPGDENELSISRNKTGRQSPKPQKTEEDVSRQNQKICTRIPPCNPCNADCGAVNETINPNDQDLPVLINPLEPGDENESGLQNQNQQSPSKIQTKLSTSRNQTGQSPKSPKNCTRNPPCKPPCIADCGLVNKTIDPNSEHNETINKPPSKDEKIIDFAKKYWHVFSEEYNRIIGGVPLDPKSTERQKEIRAFTVQNVNIIRPIHEILVLYMESVNTKADLDNREPIPEDAYKGLGILRQLYVNTFCARSNWKDLNTQSDARQKNEGRQANGNNREQNRPASHWNMVKQQCLSKYQSPIKQKLSNTETNAGQRDGRRQANRKNRGKISDELKKQWAMARKKWMKPLQKRDEGVRNGMIRITEIRNGRAPNEPDPCCAFGARRGRRKKHTTETPKLSPRPWMQTDKPKKKKEFSLTDEQKALVLDNYYPGLIHDAVNQKADFNEIAQKFVTPETAVDGNKAEKGMSLLEAFDTRVKYEQIMLKGLSSLSPDKANAAQSAYQPVYGPSPHPIVSDIVLEESVRASAIPVDLQQFIRTIPESDPVRAIACLSRAQQLNDYYKEYKAAQAAANLAPPDQIEEAALFGAKTFKIDSLSSETKAVHTDSYKSWELVSYVGITKPG